MAGQPSAVRQVMQRGQVTPFPQNRAHGNNGNNRNATSNAGDRATLQSRSAEMSTLGAMIMERAAITTALSILAPDASDFFPDNHRKIFAALVARHDKGETTTLFDIVEELRARGQLEEIGGGSYLTALVEACAGAANIESYAKVVLKKSLARHALGISDIMAACLTVADGDETIDKINDAVHSLNGLIERDSSLHAAQEYSYDSVLDVILDEISWLWPGWIPRGSLTLLAGRPGAGKSTVAMDICKRVLMHLDWPDGKPMGYADPFEDQDESEKPTRLLWVDTESALGIFRDRLKNWGFPRDHFVFAKGNELEPVRVDEDKSWGWVVQAVRDHHPPLVVIDSLTYAHGGDENSNDYMKFVLRRLADLARDFNIGVLCIHHLNKIPYGIPDWPLTLDMIRGASAIPQFPRSVIGVGTPNKDEPLSHGFMSLKLNIATTPANLGYVTTDVGPAWGEAPTAPKPHTKIETARAWLREYLKSGPKLRNQIEERAEAEEICKMRTLDEAAKDIGVLRFKERGDGGKWWWELPQNGDQAATPVSNELPQAPAAREYEGVYRGGDN